MTKGEINEIALESLEQIISEMNADPDARPLAIAELERVKASVAPSADIWVPFGDRDTLPAGQSVGAFFFLDKVHHHTFRFLFTDAERWRGDIWGGVDASLFREQGLRPLDEYEWQDSEVLYV